MRFSNRLLALLLLVGCPTLSRAVTITSQDPTFAYVPPTSSFAFGPCSMSDPYLDNRVPIVADGCYGFINETGGTITSLTLSFQNTEPVQNSGTNAAYSDNFSNATFTPPADPSDSSEFYTFTFSGEPGVANGAAFVLDEDGVPYQEFPEVFLSYTTTATPEPSSALLMASGLACLGSFYARRRRA